MSNKVMRTVKLISLAMIVTLSAWYLTNPNMSRNKQSLNTQLATVLDKQSTPLSPFKLVDSRGKVFDQNSLRGQWTLMFFGYTTCPDICPTTLNIVKDAWNEYNGRYPARFIFASINPTHDSHSDLQNFLSNFHSEFIGVTGPSQEISKLSGQLNVVASRNDENKDLIDHSAALMLIDPKGKLKAVFTPPLTAAAIVNDLNIITK